MPHDKVESPRDALSKSEYEQLGQDLELLISTGHANKRRLMWANFQRGLFFGLGTTVGVSLLLAFLLYFLTLTKEVPLLRRVSENLEQTLNR